MAGYVRQYLWPLPLSGGGGLSLYPPQMPKKKCTKCGQLKPIEDFHRDKVGSAQRRSSCKECDSLRKRRKREKDPRGELLTHARGRAKKLVVPFSITEKDIVIPNFCPALGIPLTIGPGKIHDGSPTLDRLRPEVGYVPGNVAVLSHLANRMKNSATPKQIRLLADWLGRQHLIPEEG